MWSGHIYVHLLHKICIKHLHLFVIDVGTVFNASYPQPLPLHNAVVCSLGGTKTSFKKLPYQDNVNITNIHHIIFIE